MYEPTFNEKIKENSIIKTFQHTILDQKKNSLVYSVT